MDDLTTKCDCCGWRILAIYRRCIRCVVNKREPGDG